MLKPDTFALTVVLALLTSLGPMSTDMYLPSLPAIGRALSAGPSEVQLTLSVYMIGFAAGQIIYGPASDRRGRKPLLMAGLLIYGAGSIACALAVNIEMLIAARFAQAIGAAGPIVIARSIVRDLYNGTRAAQEMSRMGTIMGLVPALSPSVGALLEISFGWRASFLGAVVFTGIAVAMVLRLPETLARPSATPISARSILTGYAGLLRERHFLLYALLSATSFGGLFAFISGSSFVLQGLYGLDELSYGIAFGACAGSFVAGTFVSRKLVARLGMARTICAGTSLLAVAGMTMALATAFGPHHALSIVLPMMLYMVGVGLGMPISQAAALMPYPDRAGSASSLMGLLQMTFAAGVGVAAGLGVKESPWSLVAAVLVLGVACAVTERLIAAGRPA